MPSPIRALLAKSTIDSHDRGIRHLARRMRDAGMEVIFINFLLIDDLIKVALEEDVDMVGISSSSGGHMPIFRKLMQGLKSNEMDHVIVLGGGLIPTADIQPLQDLGLSGVFGPGSDVEDVIVLVKELVPRAREHTA